MASGSKRQLMPRLPTAEAHAPAAARLKGTSPATVHPRISGSGAIGHPKIPTIRQHASGAPDMKRRQQDHDATGELVGTYDSGTGKPEGTFKTGPTDSPYSQARGTLKAWAKHASANSYGSKPENVRSSIHRKP
jgi:hypothetical protein